MGQGTKLQPPGHNHPARKPIDEATGFVVLDDFERFSQRDDVFCRSSWDPEVASDKVAAFYRGHDMPHAKARGADGFGQRDYALRNASWHLTHALRDPGQIGDGRSEGFLNLFSLHGDGWPESFPYASPHEASRDVKRVAKVFGADLVGVCANDERWVYAERFDSTTKDSAPSELPNDLPWVIVIATAMDRDLIRTVPSALSGVATGAGYMNDASTLVTLAQFIRNLGYRAYASMNDTAMAIPMAAQAGLGEVGRHSLLITEEFGPRVRLGKIFTDMPLMADLPKSFGVRAFCDICNACAAACPPKAIPCGPPSAERHNRSNLKGVVKWSTDAEKCFGFWAAQNSDCSICVRVCPYNRDYTKWWHRAWRSLAGTGLRGIALHLDRWLATGRRHRASWWWGRD
ncbi:MAG: reductive dehalogenase [Proteobacteria bacterium]|nr:reductive dehalogenase [Pseudomonadota bacterium]